MSEDGWVGTIDWIDWTYVEEQRKVRKGARMVVDYADGRPRETYIVEDVHDHKDGSTILDVRLDGHDDVSSFQWHGLNDESPAQPSEDD